MARPPYDSSRANDAPISTQPTLTKPGTRAPGPIHQAKDPSLFRRVGYVATAWDNARTRYVMGAIGRQTSEEFRDLVKMIVPGLLIAAAGLIVTTALGAVVGAIAGTFVTPGLGTGAGLAAGAQIGFSVGLFLLDWLGVGFLVAFLATRMKDVGDHIAWGIKIAWDSAGNNGKIDNAAREMAEGVALFFSLLLQGLLLFIAEAAAAGKLGPALAKLRGSKLFKDCVKLEKWIADNYAQLCFRYKIKSGIRVIAGGGENAAQLSNFLAQARSVLGGLMLGGSPKFKTVQELHEFLTNRGLTLRENIPFGPDHPDARQLLYATTDNRVVVKIKTMGYKDGTRAGGTLSVEVTDGKGIKWENALYKLDRDGNVIAKWFRAADDVIFTAVSGPGKTGVQVLTADAKAKLKNGTLSAQDIEALPHVSPWELLEGGIVKPRDPKAFADRGHLDFAPGFDASGAAGLK